MSVGLQVVDRMVFWLGFVPCVLVVVSSVASRVVGWRPPVLVLRRWIEGR